MTAYKNTALPVATKSPGTVLAIGCIAVVGFLLVGPFLAMLAWNAFVPAVLNGPAIDFPTALAGTWLLGILRSFISQK